MVTTGDAQQRMEAAFASAINKASSLTLVLLLPLIPSTAVGTNL